MFGPALLAIALAAAPQNPAPSDEASHSDAALSRIRARLAKPERLHVSTERELPEPTFRVEIRQHPYFTEVPYIWTFAGGGVPLTAPGLEHMGGSMLPQSFGGGTDVLPALAALKRALDEHAAKAEVQKAILEFCATHLCVLPR